MPRATVKNNALKMCNHCNVARRPKAQGKHCTTEGHYFSMLIEANSQYLFFISRNKCNKFVWSSMTQQHRIGIDLPNTLVGPKIDTNAWYLVIYTMLPGNMDHVTLCSRGTWRCTDETGQRCLFLHITWCALDQSRPRNLDLDITITRSQDNWQQSTVAPSYSRLLKVIDLSNRKPIYTTYC